MTYILDPQDRPRVYVAGPYSKDPTAGTLAAHEAGERLRQAGALPFVPHLMFGAWPMGYGPTMEQCLGWVHTCDALLRLPGESSGTDREAAEMELLRRPVFHDEAACVAFIAAWKPAQRIDTSHEARRALCRVLDRLGDEGVVPWLNGSPASQLADDVYAVFLATEKRARQHAEAAALGAEDLDAVLADWDVWHLATLPQRHPTGHKLAEEWQEMVAATQALAVATDEDRQRAREHVAEEIADVLGVAFTIDRQILGPQRRAYHALTPLAEDVTAVMRGLAAGHVVDAALGRVIAGALRVALAHGIDPIKALRAKLEINRQRRWTIGADGREQRIGKASG